MLDDSHEPASFRHPKWNCLGTGNYFGWRTSCRWPINVSVSVRVQNRRNEQRALNTGMQTIYRRTPGLVIVHVDSDGWELTGQPHAHAECVYVCVCSFHFLYIAFLSFVCPIFPLTFYFLSIPVIISLFSVVICAFIFYLPLSLFLF
jgi:hypothetical protein